MMFIGVFALWAWTARPIIITTLNWFGLDIPYPEKSYTPTTAEIDAEVERQMQEKIIIDPLKQMITTPTAQAVNVVVEVIMPTQSAAATPTPYPSAPSSPENFTYQPDINPELHCFNCDVHRVQVILTHYWPNAGEINCWDYNAETGYCDSAMASTVPWEAFVGIGAACPYDWPF